MALCRQRQAVVYASVLLGTSLAAIAACSSPSANLESPPSPAGQPAAERALAEDETPQAGEEPEIAGAGEESPAEAAPAAASPKRENRLAGESSPYLLLHAHNPVDWYPWGEEALAKAKKEDKPIFLSIGYSSCYWCHVMERESFMDEEIARLLNENFVCIKIDREERPDIDNVYMTSLQMLGRRGGWPLSMFLTPQAKPFFGGTYWPARDGDRQGHAGFLSVATMVADTWRDKRELLEDDAERLSAAVRLRLRGGRPIEVGKLDHAAIEAVWEALQEEYDPQWGGFSYSPSDPQRPKFPEPSNLLFLIDRLQRRDVEDWEKARAMLTTTLDKMAQGGIYDHLGGGFHRYSVDRYWHIPHFEKMLYDNGQLASVYAEAYKLTGNEEYKHAVAGILDFVQREMMDDAGAFYAALDAETDAEEGKFYRWEKEQLDRLLGESGGALFREIYNLHGEPNFEEKYFVPMLSKPLNEHAQERRTTLEELRERLEPARGRLFAARQERPRPLTDIKLLTSWNGLMIRGFADAGRLLAEDEPLAAARRAADFVLENLQTDDGRLLRTHTAGEAKLNAYLDDYAFLTDGLIALHRATGEQRWLAAAEQLTEVQIELFWDERDGGFFYTSSDHEQLIARAKDSVDGVTPSGNSVSAGNLLYLAEHLDRRDFREKAEQTIGSATIYFRTSPGSVPRMAVQLAEFLSTEKSLGKKPPSGEPDSESTDSEQPE